MPNLPHLAQQRRCKVKEKVITDNIGETITVKWTGEVFALIRQPKIKVDESTRIIMLNPREMLELINFAGSCGGKV